MNGDIGILQNISDTLENNPQASQRILAERAGMSIGLMNAVLRRFVQRGWIMLSNVNLRKLSYAITPKGVAELTKRSRTFARRTFQIANDYNESLGRLAEQAIEEGKTKIILYGESYIKFLLAYTAQSHQMDFLLKETNCPVCSDALCIAGELNSEDEIKLLSEKGCINLLDLL